MSSFDKLFRPAGPLGGQQLSAKQLREIAADAGAAQANDIPGGGFTRTQSGTVYDVPEAAATTFSGARVYSSGTQVIVNSNSTGFVVMLTFDTVIYDEGGYCDLTSHPTRLTVPEDGFYHVGANVSVYTNSPPYHFVWSTMVLYSLTPSGALYMPVCHTRIYMPTDAFFDYKHIMLHGSGDLYLPANHYFIVYIEANGCDGLVDSYPKFWVHKIN